MTYEELSQNLNKEILPAYMINGGESFLTTSALEMIENACNITLKDFNVAIIPDSYRGSAQSIVESCEAMPFADSRRLIVVSDYLQKKNETEKEVFVKYLSKPNNSTCLVFFATNKSDFFDSFAKKVENISCDKVSPAFLNNWCKERLTACGLSAKYDVLSKLLDYCNYSITKLNTEISKLSSIKSSSGLYELTIDDIEKYITKDLEYVIFDLTKAISFKQNDKVYTIIDDMLKNKESPVSIISLIGNHFKRLFFAARSVCPQAELATYLGVKEFAVTKYKEQAATFSQKQLKYIFDTCVSVEAMTKSGQMEGKNALYYLLACILK